MDIIEELDAAGREWNRLLQKLQYHHPNHPRLHKPRFTFFINNLNFTAMSQPTLTVPSGTPVSGFNKPLDSGGNVLPDSAYKTGSCKYTVVPGPSGNPPGFTVAPTDDEEDFAVTELVPGAASDGQINFDAQDVNGNQLPTSSGILAFTAVAPPPPPPPPPVAVASQFNFNAVPTAAAAQPAA